MQTNFVQCIGQEWSNFMFHISAKKKLKASIVDLEV